MQRKCWLASSSCLSGHCSAASLACCNAHLAVSKLPWLVCNALWPAADGRICHSQCYSIARTDYSSEQQIDGHSLQCIVATRSAFAHMAVLAISSSDMHIEVQQAVRHVSILEGKVHQQLSRQGDTKRPIVILPSVEVHMRGAIVTCQGKEDALVALKLLFSK